MLGIIGAMDIEVDQLKAAMEEVTIAEIAGMKFYQGTLKGKPVVVVRCGVGKVNAAVCVQAMVDRYSVDKVVNTGIAGSLNKKINIGDIVLSTDVVQHDMNAVKFGYPEGQIPMMDEFGFSADEELLKLAMEGCHRVNPGVSVYEGRIVSGDQFISDREKKNWIVEKFGALCTEMEGAAIGQAAYLNKVPFLIIRAISDKADDSAVMDYGQFEELAAKNSVNLILSLLERL